jgi:hypothetical protein
MGMYTKVPFPYKNDVCTGHSTGDALFFPKSGNGNG